MIKNIYKGKTVLITGHTGFKGGWLSTWLSILGAKVIGVSIDVPTSPSIFNACLLEDCVKDYRLDIRNAEDISSLVEEVQPDFVFHLAAQALVRSSYKDPLNTIGVNAIGSVNVLEALKSLSKKVIVLMITSDKVYDNVEWVWGYRETDRIGGKDPYSASKGMAEIGIRSYVDSYFNTPDSNVKVGIVRAGNVIGGGDWALDRIVPDCMVAWSNGNTVDIRNPQATRPWQHVLEPLSGYLSLAGSIYKNGCHHGESYNFGPLSDQNYPVSILIDKMSVYWDKVKWRDVSFNKEYVHEAGLLKLNCDKALFDLGWHATLNFEETVKMTVEWYKEYYKNNNKSMRIFTENQILYYTNIAESQGLLWANGDD